MEEHLIAEGLKPNNKKKYSKQRATSKRPYRVFVSSTFLDNQDRRQIVEEAITTAGMVWHGMEVFTAEGRPAVDACLDYAAGADVLLGIIAWRYGWIPERSDISITEMEYDAARSAGKQRLMFVLDPSIKVDPERDFDQDADRWDKQKKLEAFKRKIRVDQMPAHFNPSNLSGKVVQALHLWRERQEGSGAAVSARRGPKTEKPHRDNEEIFRYCHKAVTFFSTVPVAGFVTQLKVNIDIEDIYVPLRAMLDLTGISEEEFCSAEYAEKCFARSEAATDIDLPEIFRELAPRRVRGVVILGDPGAGKTTHLQRLLLYCLRNGSASIGLPKDMLPVFLSLRKLRRLDHGLDSFIEEELQKPHLEVASGFGRRLLNRGNLLFLFDGLDEVADLEQRERVAGWLVDAMHAYGDCMFVVTCRYAGYSPTVRLSGGFLETHIRPLSKDQADRFIANWYATVERGLAVDPDQADIVAREKSGELIDLLAKPDFRAARVFEMTRNPLLLTNICLVHRHRGGLPRKRTRLYEECIDVLLERWQDAKGLDLQVTARDGARALQPAALWLHEQGERTWVTSDELAPHVEPVLKAVGWQKGDAGAFLKTIRDVSGLLTGWDQDRYGFIHLGFQEYLAAREVRRRHFGGDEEVLALLAERYGESWWQEVILLLLGLEDPSLFVPFMRHATVQACFADHPAMLDACLEDAAEVSAVPFVELLREPPEDNRELWHRQLAALRALERVDPERLENLEGNLSQHPLRQIRRRYTDRAADRKRIVSVVRGIDMVAIPAAIFLMGSSENEGSCAERPRHEVSVRAFEMGRYPVTNARYAAFLKDTGTAEPRYWADRRFNGPEQPVVGVSWEEACLFASWAGGRLPSEAEWEYACRAGTGTSYCTGSGEKDLDRAGWYSGNSDGRPHPVGEKEPNAFGLYDIHGNVWEWIEDDWHDSYEGAPTDGSAWIDEPERGASRVIRGGSWNFPAEYCRSAFRRGRPPGTRSLSRGFRLARSS
jgi:formylglycine-generating enzyme required for sulfatase activity